MKADSHQVYGKHDTPNKQVNLKQQNRIRVQPTLGHKFLRSNTHQIYNRKAKY